MDPTRANREVYDLLRDGYLADVARRATASEQTARIAYVDWRDPDAQRLARRDQVWIAGDLHTRRVDLVLFVNGIPLVLAEFKEREPAGPARRTTRTSPTTATRSRSSSGRTRS